MIGIPLLNSMSKGRDPSSPAFLHSLIPCSGMLICAPLVFKQYLAEGLTFPAPLDTISAPILL
jgi:hypothetical protein